MLRETVAMLTGSPVEALGQLLQFIPTMQDERAGLSVTVLDSWVDDEGYVWLRNEPGLGQEIDHAYIDANPAP